jgi:hypothetical protein
LVPTAAAIKARSVVWHFSHRLAFGLRSKPRRLQGTINSQEISPLVKNSGDVHA